MVVLGMHDRRTHGMLCADLVDVRWQNARGKTLHAIAILEDVSVSSACFYSDRAFPLQTKLRISISKGELQGQVQQCISTACGYVVTVAFEQTSSSSPLQICKPDAAIAPHMHDRTEQHLRCADRVHVEWQSKSGEVHRETATLEDFSVSGACLHSERSFQIRTALRIVNSKGELTVRVCDCVYTGVGYLITVAFEQRFSPARQQLRALYERRNSPVLACRVDGSGDVRFLHG
jgi:hypothetical protein